MKWNPLPTAELVRRLELPQGKIDMVLDTDTYNEVDDQFALAYCLLSPERLNVQAVYAAPFHNDRSNGPEDGMVKSYAEILRIMGTMRHETEGFVFEGSRRYLPDGETFVDSPAARDLVARAMARDDDDDPLYVVAIGAITNVASAILMEPRITGKIVVVWLGGHALDFTTAKEFNLMQDVAATRTIFDSGVPTVLVPCVGAASHMLTTVQELTACLGGKNALCDMLIELFSNYSDDHFAWGKEIWDVAPVGYLINPAWVPSALAHSPLLTDDLHWAKDASRHFIRVAIHCHRNPIFRDMFEKLAGA